MNKPMTAGGKASICHWNLKFSFLTRHQCISFIEKYLASDIANNFSYEEFTLENGETEYIIEIEDMPWANNLVVVADILEKVDYEFQE